jgi:ferric-dicitrate binding protein FerR (iron transport regulator)
MTPSDENKSPNKTTRPWFWDLLRKASSGEPSQEASGSIPDVTFKTPDISDEKVDRRLMELQLSINALESEDAGAASARPAISKMYPARTIYRLAASVVLLIAAGLGVWSYLRAGENAHTTHYGETARIKLPDGSMVVLNAHSTLTYNDWSEGQTREVWLNGEAFFEVQKKHDATGRVKFVVHTGDLNVEVLGTRFNVSNRGLRTQIVLEEGKVRLRYEQETEKVIDMQPGELVEYVNADTKPIKRTVNAKSFTAWKEDLMVLDGKSMRDVARLITENYGIEVIIGDAATANVQLKGSIPANNLAQLIEALSLAADIQVIRQPNQLIFKQP